MPNQQHLFCLPGCLHQRPPIRLFLPGLLLLHYPVDHPFFEGFFGLLILPSRLQTVFAASENRAGVDANILDEVPQ